MFFRGELLYFFNVRVGFSYIVLADVGAVNDGLRRNEEKSVGHGLFLLVKIKRAYALAAFESIAKLS